MLPKLSEVRAAAELIQPLIPPTPQFCWPLLCERTGTEVWVKHENHHATGAFKIRGGLVYLDELTQSGKKPLGIVTATRGNHGQSIAFACQQHDVPCVVVVPRGNSVEKNLAMQAWGAELIEYGEDYHDAAHKAEEIAADRDMHVAPTFHPSLLQGVATYWLEFFEAIPALDTVFVPIGMGSGICSAIAVRDALEIDTKIVGVVSSAAPSYALSWEAGEIIEHPTTTKIADGIAVRRGNPAAFAIIREGASRIVQVTDEEVKDAMRAYFVDTHNLAEGAGAAPLAALIQEKNQLKNKKVGVILCGGNVDQDVFAQVLAPTQ